MKRLVFALAGLALAGSVTASSGVVMPYPFKADSASLPSLQRGARNFMSYCSGCHSMKHLRYSRMGEDLGIPEDRLKADFMLSGDKPGDHIKSRMPASAWPGPLPPDLTVETRLRGADWVYNFLMTFYVDSTRPMGVNNLLLPGASMPNVLGGLQGWQEMKPAPPQGAPGADHGRAPTFEIVRPGTLSPEEYRSFVADTVNFMDYAAEPGKARRISLGIKVMLYLLVLTTFAYFMKREWWKDVH